MAPNPGQDIDWDGAPCLGWPHAAAVGHENQLGEFPPAQLQGRQGGGEGALKLSQFLRRDPHFGRCTIREQQTSLAEPSGGESDPGTNRAAGRLALQRLPRASPVSGCPKEPKWPPPDLPFDPGLQRNWAWRGRRPTPQWRAAGGCWVCRGASVPIRWAVGGERRGLLGSNGQEAGQSARCLCRGRAARVRRRRDNAAAQWQRAAGPRGWRRCWGRAGSRPCPSWSPASWPTLRTKSTSVMLRLTGTRTSQPSKPAAHLLPSRSLASASCFSRSSRRRGRSSFRSFSVLPAARAPSSSPARPCSTFSVATLQHEATNALDSSFCLPPLLFRKPQFALLRRAQQLKVTPRCGDRQTRGDYITNVIGYDYE